MFIFKREKCYNNSLHFRRVDIMDKIKTREDITSFLVEFNKKTESMLKDIEFFEEQLLDVLSFENIQEILKEIKPIAERTDEIYPRFYKLYRKAKDKYSICAVCKKPITDKDRKIKDVRSPTYFHYSCFYK